MNVQCPHCRGSCSLQLQRRGQRFTCCYCGGEFTVGAPRRPRWVPGTPHPQFPNVVASDEEGVWSPAPGYAWVTSTPGDFRVQMVDDLQFICTSCKARYHGPLSVGSSTRCDHCGKVFTVFKHLGDYSPPSEVAAVVQSLNVFSWFRSEKCPRCGQRNTTDLGTVNMRQRVIDGDWCNAWLNFYSCSSCKVTWSKGEGAPA
jgi:phage FluMu protein Com